MAISPSGVSPSCRHTTIASAVPQPSSHTVPHWALLQNSTRPSMDDDPPTSLRSPWAQAAAKGWNDQGLALIGCQSPDANDPFVLYNLFDTSTNCSIFSSIFSCIASGVSNFPPSFYYKFPHPQPLPMHLRSRHLTPASSLCAQLCVPMGFARQSNNLASVPVQRTLSKKILTELAACPKPARATAPAPEGERLRTMRTTTITTTKQQQNNNN